MRPRSRILLLAIATALVLAFALVLLDRPAARSRAGASATGANTTAADASAGSGFDGALLPGAVDAPDFTLTDQHGRRVTLGQYRGRVTILTFLSSACSETCPLIAQQIRGALDELDDEHARPPAVLVVSADPAGDSPARVTRFLAEASLTGRVQYLTGPVSRLRAIWAAYRIKPASAGAREFDSYASVLLLDTSGRERVLFQEEQLTPESLAHDIRKLDGDPAHP